MIVIPYILSIVILILLTLVLYYHLKLKQVKAEVGDPTAGIFVTLNTFQHIEQQVDQMFQQTNATRFLILSATRSEKLGTNISAIYEHSNEEKAQISVGATGRYVNVIGDEHYEAMLNKIEEFEYELFWTDTMQTSLLQQIYEAEKVVCSYVILIGKYQIDEHKERVIYCSIATHNPEGFLDEYQQEFIRLARNIRFKIDEVQNIVNTLDN